MASLERYGRASALLVLLAATSWAQTSLPGGSPDAQVVEAPGAPALNPHFSRAADLAMAESAAVAMANITGVATVTPATAESLPQTLPPADPQARSGLRGSPMIQTVTTLTTPHGVAECKLLDKDFGKFMQLLLLLCVCLTLVLKYNREGGGRTKGEFMLDSSKQLIGAGWIHVLNLVFAKALDAFFQGYDQCNWYFINIILDCTIGVAVEYVLLLSLTKVILAISPNSADDFDTGDYKGKDDKCNPSRYMKQVTMWLLIVSLMKVAMLFVMSVGNVFLMGIAEAALAPVQSNADAKLFVVMILTPICMNIFQFWVTDSFIKKQAHHDHDAGDTEQDGSMQTRIRHGDL